MPALLPSDTALLPVCGSGQMPKPSSVPEKDAVSVGALVVEDSGGVRAKAISVMSMPTFSVYSEWQGLKLGVR